MAESLQKPVKKNRPRFSRSGADLFRDLGFSSEDAQHLAVRADLMIEIEKAILRQELKQADAARLMRVSQPRVSDLLRGRIELFSTDSLIDMLARLGVAVRLVTRRVRSKGQATRTPVLS